MDGNRAIMKQFFNNRCFPHLPQETELLNLLYHEIKTTKCEGKFPKNDKIALLMNEYSSRAQRRELLKKERDGGCPLFLAAKLGNTAAVEWLVSVGNADIEQRCLFEVTQERTVHLATALWVAAVNNQLPVVKLLVRLGANINAISDSGSTAVRSACFMTNKEVGE